MKKIIIFYSALVLLLASCGKKGQILHEPSEWLINGKMYKLVQVVPADGANAIWIMYPKDSTDTDKPPVSINWTQNSGKTTVGNAVIKID